MGCQSEVIIGNNMVFSICTHDPDTGHLTDTDSPPVYRVYEEETATAILTGTMAKLDDVNTLGFYTELIACTLANGFEAGKSYTVYIEATVDSDTGGIAYGFRIMADIAAAVWAYATRILTQSAASVTAAVSGSTLAITRGDTFSAAITGLGSIAARSKLWFTIKSSKDALDGGAVVQIEETAGLVYFKGLDASARLTNGSVTVSDAAAGNLTIALDEAETDDLGAVTGLYYDIQMLTTTGVVTTLTEGTCNITDDVTRVIT